MQGFSRGVDPAIEELWHVLLGSAAEACEPSEGSCIVGSWGDVCSSAPETTITVGDVVRVCACAGVEEEWYPWLAGIDWWPDVHRWVRVVFGADAGLRLHGMAREEPVPFALEDGFIAAVESRQAHVVHRDALTRALTKKVYGILDHGFG